jgi:hypothetical protein
MNKLTDDRFRLRNYIFILKIVLVSLWLVA